MADQTKISKCEKFGCRPRINEFGVSWCTECGKLFTFNLNHKPLDKNFLIKKDDTSTRNK